MNRSRSKAQSALFETEYLKSTVGPILAIGLAEIVERRPADPIEYLATFLYRRADINHTKKQLEKNDKRLRAKKETVNRNKQYRSQRQTEEKRKPNVERLKILLTTSENVEIFTIEFRETELHRKAALQNVNLLKLLQANHLSIAVRNSEGKTPRDVALAAHLQDNVNQIDHFCFKLLEKGNIQAIKNLILLGYTELVDRLKTIENTNKDTLNFINEQIPIFLDRIKAFKEAIIRGNKIIIQFIVEYYQSIAFYRDSEGSSSLHDAIENRQFHIALYLIEKYPQLAPVKDIHHRTGFDLLNIISTASLTDKQYDIYDKLQEVLMPLTPE